MRLVIVMLLGLGLAACQQAYYEAAEKVGYHKRDILVDRVEDSRDAQQQAEEQFTSALEQLQAMVNYDGGDLEKMYDDMVDVYEDSRASADKVSERIDAVDNVANSLFKEWEAEINEYTSASLKADSQAKLTQTRKRYQSMIAALRSSEAKMDPVLASLNDNVLYLKHNLNAQSIASLKTEFKTIEGNIDALIIEMRKAIASSDAFIASMK
jgi:Skp family chaperone for outer membrane proteins